MTSIFTRLLGPLLLLWLGFASITEAAAPKGKPWIHVSLLAEDLAFRPGKTHWVGIRQEITPQWHTYWRNPGDSGMPPSMTWKRLPKGVTISPIHWPLPHKIKVGPLANYGYDNEVLLLFKVRIAKEFKEKQLTLQGRFSWLVCKEECIPGAKNLSLRRLVSTDFKVSKVSPHRALFARFKKRLPQSHTTLKTTGKVTAKTLALTFQGLKKEERDFAKLQFFPGKNQIIKHFPTAKRKRVGDTLVLTFEKNDYFPEGLKKLEGILQIALQKSVRVQVSLGNPAAATAPLARKTTRTKASASAPKPPAEVAKLKGISGFLQTMFLSILVGLLLNLMPCVFPVLTVKVLHFLEIAEHDPQKARRHGVSYTVGVMLSFTVLAVALIALRAGGSFVGWGFQLQSPVFILLLTVLMFAMGLSLSGLFEVGTSLTRLGGMGATQSGYLRSFSTGVLATIVATPCLAPWMWVAIAYALSQPAIVGVLVFNALGFGMALPYLLLSSFPALLRFMPRPGAWMETFKQLMAFPLYGTAIWLLWVLGKQAGVEGMLQGLIVLVGVSFGLWLFAHLKPRYQESKRWLPVVLAALISVGSFGYGQKQLSRAAQSFQNARKTQKVDGHLVYSKTNFERYAKQKQHLFLNFTAAWCVSCKVNEKLVLQRTKVQSAFRKHGVRIMVGDWTNADPEISAVLKRFGRDGVPLYLLYDGQKKTFQPLPQLLTPVLVFKALKKLSNPSGGNR